MNIGDCDVDMLDGPQAACASGGVWTIDNTMEPASECSELVSQGVQESKSFRFVLNSRATAQVQTSCYEAVARPRTLRFRGLVPICLYSHPTTAELR